MIKVVKYEKKYLNIWNLFIDKAKNGHFMFKREYMEYHIDKFNDFSLMFFNNNKLLAVLPANINGNTFISHEGLTFGGIISTPKITTVKMIEIFNILIKYLKNERFTKLIYKPVPNIYHTMPSSEDLYALFINNAKLYRRDVSSTIYMKNRGKYSKGRKSAIKKALKNKLEVKQSFNFNKFMEIEKSLLNMKYGINPVHTGNEITMLANRFPENIKLFMAFIDDLPLGGVVIYENKNVAHCQYIAITDKGKELGALDLIINYLLNDYYKDLEYFDFGISTEKNGKYLNINLIKNKESFGASATVYDFYSMDL